MESIYELEAGGFEADYATAMRRYAEALSPESETIMAPDGRRARFAAAVVAVDTLALRERFTYDHLKKLRTLVAGLNTHGHLDIKLPITDQKEAADIWQHTQRIAYASIEIDSDAMMSGAELLHALNYNDGSIRIIAPRLND